jgi:hypothetical protein
MAPVKPWVSIQNAVLHWIGRISKTTQKSGGMKT